MFFKPFDGVGTGGDGSQIPVLQLLDQFFHQFSCDTLAAQRLIDKSVVYIYSLIINIGKCDFSE